MRSINARISGPMIQEVALTFANKFAVSSFKASNGWLEKFKHRHEISQRILVGHSNEVPVETIDSFKERFKHFSAGFEPKDIFNADECGLFYRAMPNCSLVQKGDSCKSGKQSKDRLTVLFATSMTGEKLTPLVIGKSSKPRCFKNLKKENLPVVWKATKKAWINSIIYTEWLTNMNILMKRQKRNILMIVDNCPAHPVVPTMSNITVKHLLPNSTSKLQPLDQGIIKSFKAHYRKYLLKSILIDSKDVSELSKQINVLDAIKWIDLAWKTISEETISKCFSKAGFNIITTNEVDNFKDETIDENMKHLSDLKLISNSDWNVFLSFDDDLAVCEEIKLENIVDCVYDELMDEANKSDSEQEELNVKLPFEKEKMTAREARIMVKKLAVFVSDTCPEMLTRITELENYLDNYILSSMQETLRQSTIDMFFKIDNK